MFTRARFRFGIASRWFSMDHIGGNEFDSFLHKSNLRGSTTPALPSLPQNGHNRSIHARNIRLWPFYTDYAQSHPLQQLPPPSLCPFHSSKSHHTEVHRGGNGRSASIRKHLIHDDDAGIVSSERREGVGEDLAAGDVEPIVKDVAEEVNRCP